MRIMHTEVVRIFCELTGVKQALFQQIITTVEETYIGDIRNRTTNSIYDAMEDVITHIQDNYFQPMPHELLKRN